MQVQEVKNELSYEDVLFPIIIVLVWGCIFFNSGVSSVGPGLLEDYEIFQINNQLKTTSVTEILVSQISYELHGRFRPLFLVYRVLGTYLLGTDILLWQIILCSSFILISIVAFFTARKWGLYPLHSFLISIFTLAGTQTEIAWRLSNAEFGGVACSLLSLYWLKTYLDNERWVSALAQVGFAFLACLWKESFLLFIPVHLFIMFYVQFQKQCRLGTVINNLFLSIYLYGCLLSFYVWLFFIRVPDPGNLLYTGANFNYQDVYHYLLLDVDCHHGLVSFITSLIRKLFYSELFEAEILVFFFLLLAVAFRPLKKYRKPLYTSSLLILFLCFAQWLLYLRVILSHIYLYPLYLSIGVWLGAVLLLFQKTNLSIIRLRFLTLLLLATTCLKLKSAYVGAQQFYLVKSSQECLIGNILGNKFHCPMLICCDDLQHLEFTYAIESYFYIQDTTCKIGIFPVQGDPIEFIHFAEFKDTLMVAPSREIFLQHFERKFEDLSNNEAQTIIALGSTSDIVIDELHKQKRLSGYRIISSGKSYYKTTIFVKKSVK